MSVYALAVHSSLGFKKCDYFFRYKGREFRYVPGWRDGWTDKLLTLLKTQRDSEKNEAYRLAAELLSAIAFERDAGIILSSGVIAHGNGFDLAEITGGYTERRKIPVTELISEFYYIPPVRNDDQRHVIRLYREARSSNSLYLELLFYWHILVYPNTDDASAVRRLDTMLSQLDSDAISRVKDIRLC